MKRQIQIKDMIAVRFYLTVVLRKYIFKNIPKHSFLLTKPTLKRETILVESNLFKFYQSLTVTSLVVQWFRLHTSNVGSTGSIPGQGSSAYCTV